MAQSRSQFLKGALKFGAMGAIAPSLVMEGHLAERVLAAGSRDNQQNILVVVQLAGGNDGLNSLVPYGDGLYYQKRPTLAVPQSQVLHLNNHVGFNPNLTKLKGLYDQGKVAVIQGVGYANPNYSHFRSTDIWQSALPDGYTDTGWLGRFLDSSTVGSNNPLKAISIGPLLPKAFWAKNTLVPAVQSIASFNFLAAQHGTAEAQRVISAFQASYGGQVAADGPYLSLVQLGDSAAYQQTIQVTKAAAVPVHAQYPSGNALAGQLKLVSQVIASNLGTRVFMVTQGGYDDHAQEANAHPRLMAELGEAISAFYQDMAGQNRANQVMMMTFSEFGRRPLENASNGTDHGSAAPMFVIGGAVKGGLYGQQPSLSDLDNGNLKYTTDFRSVYSTVLANFMGADPTKAVMGKFPTLNFV